MAARSDRPTRREISCVRPPMRPFTDSRSERVWVERGSIAYSAVTQPSPLPLRQRGTPSVTDAAHSTRVRPNSTRTEPSAWSSQSRVMTAERSWSSARPSGRGIADLSDVVDGAGAREGDVTAVRVVRLGEGTAGVAPRDEMGEQQPLDLGARRMLAGLLAGE